MTRTGWCPRGPRRAALVALASVGLWSCREAPETIGLSRLVLMAADARDSSLCGKILQFQATALASSDPRPDLPRYYHAQDPDDGRATIVIVSGDPIAEGTNLSVTGRLTCEQPFPAPSLTYYVQEMSRTSD